MSDYTKYLRLMKPAGNEYYNIENFNHNAELIDKETEKLNSAVTEIKEKKQELYNLEQKREKHLRE